MSDSLQSLAPDVSSETSEVSGIKFSLVLATIGRTGELANFLAHLDLQSYRNFELIVVDQNEDDRLERVVSPYQNRLSIKHVRSKHGLSRARNVGLKHVSGNVVAFPDDDCWYDPDTLQTVTSLLLEHPDWDGLTGGCKTPGGRLGFLDQRSGCVDKINVWRRAVSITIFLRDSVTKKVGTFDESLGVGASSGRWAGEETDYLLRAMEQDCRIFYRPDVLVNHPDLTLLYDNKLFQKTLAYERGLGYTLKKHHYPLWYLMYVSSRAFGGMALSLVKSDVPKARYYYAVLRGRLSGWLE